ncbi:helix-turn-helix transcriptional regulator [Shewanella khirikhana]|uniref:Oxygen regulatory protein NreC n=1 Tax=Shewanella khirikhana TaxID=1965282 RepID=A0ABN5TP60_9GAMM|nr:response regulator transcription factor [Shewanella khirikhana]AZQ09389.1 Oxygen regulatory protein NreC [Shewanella khirikhana]
MDIQTRASIHLEGEGFDLLPELKQLYLANGGCLRKALLNTDEQHCVRIIFVDCTGGNKISTTLARKPLTAYIAIAQHQDLDTELSILRAGFNGLIIKKSSLVMQLSAIDSLIRGEMYFSRKAMSLFITEMNDNSDVLDARGVSLDVTKKERRVVDCLLKGMSNLEIADTLNISPNTVKMHLQNIYRKNNLRGRVQLISSC